MTDKKPKQKEASSGEYSQTEQAILKYLYEHPSFNPGTVNFVQILNPGLNLAQHSEELTQALENVQYAIETLVVDKLVTGKRFLQNGLLQYSNLDLTTNGQEEAIKQKRRVPVTPTVNSPKEDQSTG